MSKVTPSGVSHSAYTHAGAAWLWIGALLCLVALGALLFPRASHAAKPSAAHMVSTADAAVCGSDFGYFDIQPVACEANSPQTALASAKWR